MLYASKANSDIVIPGKGLPAPYLLEKKEVLLDAIFKSMDKSKIVHVQRHETEA